MNKRRQSHRGLTNSRIYPKRKRFFLFVREPVENPKTGKIAKWHSLCPISDGEDKARLLAKAILDHNRDGLAAGDMPTWLDKYRLKVLKSREKDRPREPARVKLFEAGNKEITRVIERIKAGFEDFNVEQVIPVDIGTFVDNWEGQRMGQVYLSRLSDFFAWTCRKGLRQDNPCREISVEKPAKRDRYISDAEFHAIRDALLVGKNSKPTSSGPMMQCYVDLCYLLYQRTTEIRLLKWSDVGDTSIFFKPTKTEKSSGAKVEIPVSPAVKAVLDSIKSIDGIKSVYVIRKSDGQPYSTQGVGTAWERACERANVEGVTLKDLRAKALTDAKKAGYTMTQLKVAAAHTDENMTEDYIKQRETPISEVVMTLPSRPKK